MCTYVHTFVTYVYVHTYAHTYIRDPVRLQLRHLYQVEPELLRAHIFQTIWYIWFIFGLMLDIGPNFHSAIPHPCPWPKGQSHGLRNFFNFMPACRWGWPLGRGSYWHISSLLREVKQFWQKLPAKNSVLIPLYPLKTEWTLPHYILEEPIFDFRYHRLYYIDS